MPERIQRYRLELLRELIDEGYQLVTVSELLKSLGIDEKNTAYYPW